MNAGYARTARRTLWERQNGVCALCNAKMNWRAHELARDFPTLDHKLPKAHGGNDSRWNLQLAHRQCNEQRGMLTMNEWTALQSARAAQRVAHQATT